MEIKRLNILFCFTLLLCSIYAQTTTYSCDFEDATQNQQWVLNTPRSQNYDWPNLWYIGNAGAMTGENGLYVSADGGKTICYNTNSDIIDNIMIAYTDLHLTQGTYDFSFNWKAGGGSTAYMMVAWVPESQYSEMKCGINNEWADRLWISKNLLELNDGETNAKQFSESLEWKLSAGKIVSDGEKHRLLFIWVSSGSNPIAPLSVAVDNIMISRNNCGKPTNMKVQTNGNTAHLSWNTTAESVNIKYKKTGDNKFIEHNNITTTNLDITLQEGVYFCYIQVVCEGEKSVWYEFPVILIHNSSCFDFLDLTDDNCYFNNSSSAGLATVFEKGKQDQGYKSILSKHTIHYIKEEDYYTLGSTDANGNAVAALKTIPEGEIASVRLGWRGTSGQAARIVYEYEVDSKNASLLLLQYAVVMQMANHNETEQPKFTLDIKDAQSGKVLETCTSVDFSPKKNSTMEGWYYSGPVTDASTWTWKDWTTVGLNLNKYDGKKVRIELSSYGCTPTGHGCYAYFTVKCTSGHIEGIQCGDTPTNEFVAPEGFHYRWYKQFDPTNTQLNKDGMGNTLTQDSRIFKVNYKDTTTYRVDVHYITDEGCYFSLLANAMPRYPIPVTKPEITYSDCKAHIKFHNISHIRTKDLNTGVIYETTNSPDYILWDFGNTYSATDQWEPEFDILPGNYIFHLTATVGLCDSTQTIECNIPLLQDTIVTEDVVRCIGEVYNWKDKMIVNDTTLTINDKRTTGCDSTHIINLHFVDKIQAVIDTIILEGDSVIFGGKVYKESGTYNDNYISSAGCDSTIILNLTVNPRLKVRVESESPCADQTQMQLAVTRQKGKINSCSIHFDDDALAAGFTDTIYSNFDDNQDTYFLNVNNNHFIPGWYTAHLMFDSKENGTDSVQLEFMVRYPSSILAQRWNNVLGIKNSNYNGGYEFVSYQWYKAEEIIADRGNEPYYYSPEEFIEGEQYSVELVRQGEQRAVMSCPITIQHIAPDQITVTPTLTQKGGNIHIRSPYKLQANLITAQGNQVMQWILTEEYSTIRMPNMAGLYFLYLCSEKETKTIKIQLK